MVAIIGMPVQYGAGIHVFGINVGVFIVVGLHIYTGRSYITIPRLPDPFFIRTSPEIGLPDTVLPLRGRYAPPGIDTDIEPLIKLYTAPLVAEINFPLASVPSTAVLCKLSTVTSPLNHAFPASHSSLIPVAD
jgi:hypothetical protein